MVVWISWWCANDILLVQGEYWIMSKATWANVKKKKISCWLENWIRYGHMEYGDGIRMRFLIHSHGKSLEMIRRKIIRLSFERHQIFILRIQNDDSMALGVYRIILCAFFWRWRPFCCLETRIMYACLFWHVAWTVNTRVYRFTLLVLLLLLLLLLPPSLLLLLRRRITPSIRAIAINPFVHSNVDNACTFLSPHSLPKYAHLSVFVCVRASVQPIQWLRTYEYIFCCHGWTSDAAAVAAAIPFFTASLVFYSLDSIRSTHLWGSMCTEWIVLCTNHNTAKLEYLTIV